VQTALRNYGEFLEGAIDGVEREEFWRWTKSELVPELLFRRFDDPEPLTPFSNHKRTVRVFRDRLLYLFPKFRESLRLWTWQIVDLDGQSPELLNPQDITAAAKMQREVMSLHYRSVLRETANSVNLRGQNRAIRSEVLRVVRKCQGTIRGYSHLDSSFKSHADFIDVLYSIREAWADSDQFDAFINRAKFFGFLLLQYQPRINAEVTTPLLAKIFKAAGGTNLKGSERARTSAVADLAASTSDVLRRLKEGQFPASLNAYEIWLCQCLLAMAQAQKLSGSFDSIVVSNTESELDRKSAEVLSNLMGLKTRAIPLHESSKSIASASQMFRSRVTMDESSKVAAQTGRSYPTMFGFSDSHRDGSFWGGWHLAKEMKKLALSANRLSVAAPILFGCAHNPLRGHAGNLEMFRGSYISNSNAFGFLSQGDDTLMLLLTALTGRSWLSHRCLPDHREDIAFQAPYADLLFVRSEYFTIR
jgi:hypothetical protein